MMAVDEEICDLVGDDGCGVFAICKIGGEVIAVELVQSILRAHPDEAVIVLRDAANHAARHLIGCIELACIGNRQYRYCQTDDD